jgi:hypothetical protein
MIGDNDQDGRDFVEKEKAPKHYAAGIPVKIVYPHEWINDFTDWLADGLMLDQLEAIFDNTSYWETPQDATDIGDKKAYPLTDQGNAEAIADEWGYQIRYVHELKYWIVYRDGCWRQDTNGELRRMALKTIRRLHRESAEWQNTDIKKMSPNTTSGQRVNAG